MAIPRPQISQAELETLVLDVLARQGQPVTVAHIRSEIPRALRPAAKALTGIVSALADAKRIFRAGRRYSAQPDRTLHDRIVRSVAEEARSAAAVAKQLRTSADRVRKAIRELVAAGELHEHPKQGRIARYGAHAPTPADLLRPELVRFLADTKKKFGIGEDEVKRALRDLLGSSAAKGGDPIVAGIRELESDGALVYLPHLRTALAATYRDKPSFDRAVLALLARGTIQMQSHPTPSLLGAAEREAMIEDGRGGYYSAIGLR